MQWKGFISDLSNEPFCFLSYYISAFYIADHGTTQLHKKVE